MYSVEIWNKSRIAFYLIAPSVEELFELIILLEKSGNTLFYIVRTLHGDRLLPKDFGWGDMPHWKSNDNYRERD
jgi:hypothetical protein